MPKSSGSCDQFTLYSLIKSLNYQKHYRYWYLCRTSDIQYMKIQMNLAVSGGKYEDVKIFPKWQKIILAI